MQGKGSFTRAGMEFSEYPAVGTYQQMNSAILKADFQSSNAEGTLHQQVTCVCGVGPAMVVHAIMVILSLRHSIEESVSLSLVLCWGDFTFPLSYKNVSIQRSSLQITFPMHRCIHSPSQSSFSYFLPTLKENVRDFALLHPELTSKF